MLGKRPHQIQRTTSMSQLRVPPSARSRPTSDFAQAKKDLIAQKASNPSVYGKIACTNHMHPKVHEDASHVEMKILDHGNKVNGEVLPVMHPHPHPHMHDHFKAFSSPLKVVSSSPLPSLTKQTVSESFMEACYYCKRPLGHGRDIFMYRGDAAFCTEECRLRQISCDEQRQKRLFSASESMCGHDASGNPPVATPPDDL